MREDHPIKLVFEDLLEYNWFWWEEGDGACDCNRSLTIREYYPDFPLKKCGEEISLIEYELLPRDPLQAEVSEKVNP